MFYLYFLPKGEDANESIAYDEPADEETVQLKPISAQVSMKGQWLLHGARMGVGRE